MYVVHFCMQRPDVTFFFCQTADFVNVDFRESTMLFLRRKLQFRALRIAWRDLNARSGART